MNGRINGCVSNFRLPLHLVKVGENEDLKCTRITGLVDLVWQE